jgi:hypothetical protein
MKALKLFVFGVLLIIAGSVQSQLSINVHIGSPPAWGPAGYSEVQYYYLPDVEAYYDVHSSMFIYLSGNQWIRRSYLPTRYKNYNLYHGYKVVMKDYRGKTPYSNFREHKMKYARGYRGGEQRNVGDRKFKNSNREVPHYQKQTYHKENKNIGRENGNKNDRNNKSDARKNDGKEKGNRK